MIVLGMIATAAFFASVSLFISARKDTAAQIQRRERLARHQIERAYQRDSVAPCAAAYVNLREEIVSHTYGESVLDFGEGDRVALHPATDLFMRGAVYGTVQPSRQYHHITTVPVKLDATGKVVRVSPQNLRHID